MAKKDLTYFVRFGGLNLVKQKGYGKDTFHSPPAPKGLFAMPYIAQELFLVSSLDKTQPHQWPKSPEWKSEEERTDQEHKEWTEFDWDIHVKKRNKVRKNIRKEFRKTTGYIWHHLIEHVDNCEVVDRHNAWVKTSIAAWQKAFMKRSLHDRYGEKSESGILNFSIKSINSARGISGYYTKDHYEVFFDEKI